MSARLIGRTGKIRGLDQPVADMLRVGSAPGNELQIDSRTVSRQHAQVVRSGSEYYVEDLGSRNGTWLNGQRVKRFPIKHLDVLSLGPEIDLIFLESGAVTAAVPRPPSIRASIAWIDGPLAGRTQEIPQERGLLLGRAGALDALSAMSRRHAVLTNRSDRVTVEDLGSANGTWVNGESITAVTPLNDGAEVSLANLVRFRVSIVSTTAPLDRMFDEDTGQETVAVDSPGPPRGIVLEMPAMQSIDPMPLTAPATEAAPDQSTASSPQPMGATPSQDRTAEAPREPVSLPPALPVTPAATSRPKPPDAGLTSAVPREATAPAQGTPSSTHTPLRQAVDPVPAGVLEQAKAARDAIGATVDADQMPAQTSKPSRGPAPPPVAVRGSGPIVGIRLEGPEVITLNRGSFMVGRHADCDVRINARDVGRRHAWIHVREDAVTVDDLGTANGTFLDDEPVKGERTLGEVNRLRFATVEFTLTCLRSEQAR